MEENKKDVLPLEGEPLTAPQISEPVVNALAAALSKIETYVPTQYIDDGPPDIDADHLNHAEQAIMRVTNLANGAADAIAALQSQVTQLNNNLSGTKITVDILSDALNAGDGIHEYNLNGSSYTGNLPEPNCAYGNGTVYKRNKSAITVVLYGGTQEPIATNYSSDGKTWRGWKVHALKSDLDNKIQCGLSSIGEISPGESTSEITFPHSFPTAPKSVVGNIRYVGYGDSLSMQITGITTTGFSVYIHNTSSRKISIAIYWIACLN